MNHSKKRVMKLGKGFLKVQLYVGDYTLHGQRMAVQIVKDGEILQTLETDENGAAESAALDAPDLSAGTPAAGTQHFETYDVIVPEANGFMRVTVYGVHIFDGITSMLNIHLEPLSEVGPQEIIIHVPRERGVSSFNGNGVPPHASEELGSEVFHQYTPTKRLPGNLDRTALLLALILLLR